MAALVADLVAILVDRVQLGLVDLEDPELVRVVVLLGPFMVVVPVEVHLGGLAAVAEALALRQLSHPIVVSGRWTYGFSILRSRNSLFM